MCHAGRQTTVPGRHVPCDRDGDKAQRQQASGHLEDRSDAIRRHRVAQLCSQVGVALKRERGMLEEVEPDLFRRDEEGQQRSQPIEAQCPLCLLLAVGASLQVRFQSGLLDGVEARSFALVDRGDSVAASLRQSRHLGIRPTESISGTTHQRVDRSGRGLEGVGHIGRRLMMQFAKDQRFAVAWPQASQSNEDIAGVIAAESFISGVGIRRSDRSLHRFVIGGIRRPRAFADRIDGHVASDSEQPSTRLLDTLARRVQEANEYLLRSVCSGLRLHQPSETVAVDALVIPAVDLGERDRIATQGEREDVVVIPTA